MTKLNMDFGGKDVTTVKRVLLITNIISPYRIPLFNIISEAMKKESIEFKVFFLGVTEPDRDWNIEFENIRFDYKVLNKNRFRKSKKGKKILPKTRIIRNIREYRPDLIVVGGYDYVEYLKVFFLYRTVYKPKLVLWSGSHLLSSNKINGIVGALKKLIVQRSDAYVSYGSKAAEYLEYFGADKKKIYVGRNTVDTEFFSQEVERFRNQPEFRDLRSNYPKLMLIYVGQLIERKNVKFIIDAFRKADNENIGLFIVGDGPQRKELEEYCGNTSLKNVFFEGFKQRDQIIKYYALSDVLIIPSTNEVWGLVVNEASSCGLYILCSKMLGAYYDLIKEDFNGNGFDPFDNESLSSLIKKVFAIQGTIKKDEIMTSSKVSNSLGVYAEAFIKCIKDNIN